MTDHITKEAARLKIKYDTHDPYELCRDMGIILMFAPMGNYEGCCKGFIYSCSRIVSITINSDLPAELQRIVLAHELGHAVLHKEMVGMRPYHDTEIFDVTMPAEYEANIFAAELLMTEEDVLEVINEDISFFGAAKKLFVPPELLDLKWRIMKKRGYKFADSPIEASGDFLKNIEKKVSE